MIASMRQPRAGNLDVPEDFAEDPHAELVSLGSAGAVDGVFNVFGAGVGGPDGRARSRFRDLASGGLSHEPSIRVVPQQGTSGRRSGLGSGPDVEIAAEVRVEQLDHLAGHLVRDVDGLDRGAERDASLDALDGLNRDARRSEGTEEIHRCIMPPLPVAGAGSGA